MAPIDTPIFDCAWYEVLSRNAMIVGELTDDDLTKFTDMLLVYGAWSIAAINETGEVYLKNAPIFRCSGLN